jgi:hypothetical protein
MRKVNTKGRSGANKCMLMAATVFNLKKLLKYGKKPINLIANSLEIPKTKGNLQYLLEKAVFGSILITDE